MMRRSFLRCLMVIALTSPAARTVASTGISTSMLMPLGTVKGAEAARLNLSHANVMLGKVPHPVLKATGGGAKASASSSDADSSQIVYGGYRLVRTKILSTATNNNIVRSCKQAKMKPVCNYGPWADGSCILITGRQTWFLADPRSAMLHSLFKDEVRGAFFYTGGRRKPMQMLGKRYAYAKAGSTGHTLCAASMRSKQGFVYNNWQFKRVQVKGGTMSSENILKACTALKMRPVCNMNSYADGECRAVGGSWYFSYGVQSRRRGVPEEKTYPHTPARDHARTHAPARMHACMHAPVHMRDTWPRARMCMGAGAVRSSMSACREAASARCRTLATHTAGQRRPTATAIRSV